MATSDSEESSPTMQFCRSVPRTGRKQLIASPSDSENTPTAPLQPAVAPQLAASQQQQQTAACGFLMQQLSFESPPAPKTAARPRPRGRLAALQTPAHHNRQRQATAGTCLAQQQPGQSGADNSPSTPAAAGQVGTLDLNDPYTPWLRTNSKPPLPTAGLRDQAAARAPQECSPVSSTSSSDAGSPAAAEAPEAVDSLCAAVADLQLKQSHPVRPQNSRTAAEPDSAVEHTPTDAGSSRPRGPADPAAAAARCGGGSSSSDEEGAAPLMLGRRTVQRVYRRPMLTVDTDSSSGAESGDEASSSSSDNDSKHTGSCCGTAGARRRVTPGSTSSLVARRRPSSSSSGGKRGPQPTDTGYTGAYDFDAHLSTIKPPRWQLLQRQQHLEQASMTGVAEARPRRISGRSPSSASPLSPVAALSFTPAHRGKAAADGAGSPAVAPRRLSGSFLGQGLPLSPPVLKQQQLQQPGFVTPAAAGRRRAHTAQTDSKAPRPPATAGKGQRKVLWVLSEDSVDSDIAADSSSGIGSSSQPAGQPRRRPKGGEQGAGGRGVGKSAAAACATAPPKAPSSRTFARQRQQMAQDLYAQWNAQVFDSALPADLSLVWNPRLTATAGQVVDDGSMNHLKAIRGQRIPVRLELSSKVIDTEARLRTTLSHEMCHVAAWVVSKEWKEHHGAVFWAWAQRFEKQVAGIKITTCHNFDVHAPFRWQCSNYSCGKLYMRHKRSIDTSKHVCSRCSGRLLYLGKFSRDGKLIASSVSQAAAGSAAPGGGGNAFTFFVKTHFADVKRALPTGTPHKEVMTRLAAQYKEQKATVAAAAATPSRPHAGRTLAVTASVTTTEVSVVGAQVTVSTAAAAAAVVTPAVQRPLLGAAGAEAEAAAAGGSSDDEGWQTADEEVEEQTSSLLSVMDRLALS